VEEGPLTRNYLGSSKVADIRESHLGYICIWMNHLWGIWERQVWEHLGSIREASEGHLWVASGRPGANMGLQKSKGTSAMSSHKNDTSLELNTTVPLKCYLTKRFPS